VSDQELNDLLKAFDNPNHCYPQRLVDAIRLLVKERDEARQQVRDIIQRKEAQMLTLIEEGNGVARVLYCSKEDGK